MRPTQSVSMRRITLLVFAVMTLAAGRVAAQTTFAGPWQPRPTLGVALGVSGAITRNGEANSMVSGTLEIPFADNGRIRIEGARSRLPIVPADAPDSRNPADVARIRRLTISVAALKRPGAPVTGYFGAGVGFYQTRFDYAPTPPVRAGVYVHGGAEILLDGFTIDAEVGLHGFRDHPWFPRRLVTGEAVIRLKMDL
jgi:hypothetical protein